MSLHRNRFVPLLILAFLIPVASVSAQQAKRPITVEDLWKVQRLGKPSISPDGKWVAVEVTSFSMDDNSSHSHVWLLSTDGKTQKQMTTFKGKNSSPIFSPDGKHIAFISNRPSSLPSPSGRGAGGEGDGPQIYLISPTGGEARQLSKLPMAPSGLKWGPDSKTIYCVVQTWPDTPDDDSYRKKAKAKKDDKVQAHIIDDALYRYWDTWIADGKRPVVFAVAVAGGKHKNLFAGLKLSLPVTSASADSFDIAPDGKEICFTADSVKEIGTDYNLDLYTMSLEKPGEAKNITTDNPANDFNPVYSPDGIYIAFLRQATKYFYADLQRVTYLERTDNKRKYEPTKRLDRSCTNLVFSDARAQPPNLSYIVEDKGYQRLFTLNFRAGSSELTEGHSDFSLTATLKHELAFLRTDFGSPSQVLFFPDDGGLDQPRRIDKFNDSLRAQWDLGPVKNVTYKGADDAYVQMWIVHPPGFDARKKWPLLMFVHGGPHNAITTDFHFRWNAHLLASKGYVVAIPNFHGSSGFGQKFTDSITGDMAIKPFIDIMKATDYMEAIGYIDKERMAAAGASYGGYMMAWLNGHTDRFKAMVCHAGVYNWHSMAASDILRGRERALGATPWGDLKQIDKQSPQRYAANFKTPTLVMHGEKDYRVPITQGFEYYNTLRLKGVPTRLVYFPDENHWVMKPQNSRLWHREFFAWLEKYIGTGATK